MWIVAAVLIAFGLLGSGVLQGGVYSLVRVDGTYAAFRINRLTGRTWWCLQGSELSGCYPLKERD